MGLFDSNKRTLKRLGKIADKVLALEPEYAKFSDEDILNKTEEFKKRYKDGESLDSLLVEAFALVREASTRFLHMTPFRVQVMGAIAIHEGNIAEMKTGEGKTLTAVMPAYLNALPGEGVHIVTVNEYLAAREANGEIGELFRHLGLTVGLNIRELTPEEKREAYNCDVLYSTNNELGFDYLRDNMVVYKEHLVQRDLNFAIIDEVDSILIDEARTPLIISGGGKDKTSFYQQADSFVRFLKEDDYDIDIKANTIVITQSGIKKAEEYFNLDNLYDVSNVQMLHSINNALRANYIMKNGVDYIVQNGEVIIVDQFTGRLMYGRQYNEGLHQALEAKEKVEIKKETTTLATITFQNYFRMYKKIAGMTGTAKTEEEEFRSIYNMLVVEIPTNKPVIRIDANDLIFATMEAKYKAIIAEIEERHNAGQPILVGTISIDTNELISSMLKKKRIEHEVLNGKMHEREAEIIAKAGEKGAITIATNMAGRGTDIKLGEGVKELGGLAVIGTERHESRRIDNQLRGRSGRQGDPGYTRFFISADDDLMKRFGGERFKALISRITMLNGADGEERPLDFRIFSSSIQRAQRQIEGNNFDQRKTVLQYDEVLRRQREVIYGQRRSILFKDSIEDDIDQIIFDELEGLVQDSVLQDTHEVDIEKLYKTINGYYLPLNKISKSSLLNNPNDCIKYLQDYYLEDKKEKKEIIPNEHFQEFYKSIMLRVVDTYWMENIDTMDALRQSVSLASYAQINPLREYQEEGFKLFNRMIANIHTDVSKYILRAQIRVNTSTEREQVAKPIATNDGDTPVKKKPVERKAQKVGRNDPCPCGSGKKYKNCHGR